MAANNQQPLDKLKIFSLSGIRKWKHSILPGWCSLFAFLAGLVWLRWCPQYVPILRLSKAQIGNDQYCFRVFYYYCAPGNWPFEWYLGPRITAVRLLLVGSIPVFLVGLANDYTHFPVVPPGYWRHRRFICNYTVSYSGMMFAEK